MSERVLGPGAIGEGKKGDQTDPPQEAPKPKAKGDDK